MYCTTVGSVKLKDGTTPTFPINVGIKQGDNLSPTLFNIFIDDVGQCVADKPEEAVTLNNVSIPSLLYADDLVLISKSSTNMQRSVDKLEEYCSRWKLCVNIDKTKILVFGQKHKSEGRVYLRSK